jgi:hypothetical protein
MEREEVRGFSIQVGLRLMLLVKMPGLLVRTDVGL